MLQQTNSAELERWHRLATINDWDHIKRQCRNSLQTADV